MELNEDNITWGEVQEWQISDAAMADIQKYHATGRHIFEVLREDTKGDPRASAHILCSVLGQCVGYSEGPQWIQDNLKDLTAIMMVHSIQAQERKEHILSAREKRSKFRVVDVVTEPGEETE